MFWKTLKNFLIQATFIGLWWFFKKTCEELWLFRVIFKISSLVIDYRCVVIDYTIILRSYDSSVWISKLFAIGNRLHNSCNQLHILKFKFKLSESCFKIVLLLLIDYNFKIQISNLFWKLFKTILASGNRLPERKTYFSKWNTYLKNFVKFLKA